MIIQQEMFKGSQQGSPKSPQSIQECFKLMKIERKPHELFVPACFQFKIRKIVSCDFQSLASQVNGILCISFLLFTKNKQLQKFVSDRLYFNPKQQELLRTNRKKKIDRGPNNYVPVMFNKDNVKLPTSRTTKCQVQSFKSSVYYQKDGVKVEGLRICHIVRKLFHIEIRKSSFFSTFFAPFNFIKLQLTVTLDHMDTACFPFDPEKDRQYIAQQEEYMKDAQVSGIKKMSFNLLRIEQPFRQKLQVQERVQAMSRMLKYSSSAQHSNAKYDVVETELAAYTHDERQLRSHQSEQQLMKELFEDTLPTQLPFKPFKYAVFEIPLFRHPIVDMMTIFIPLWLLSFISLYVYFQPAEIMGRILNVAALMIAYAAITPIVRDNLPEASSITLVDLLLYSQLLVNILFLVSTIGTRQLYDALVDNNSQPYPTDQTNVYYNRWDDGYFIASLVISVVNVGIVLLLIGVYLWRRGGFKVDVKPKKFSIYRAEDKKKISKDNWTLTLMMERTFARYKERLIFIS